MPETKSRLTGPPRLVWRTAQVRQVIDETSRVRSLFLDVPGWFAHRPGQHLEVRLTAEDGYQAQRSYSIASAPEAPQLSLTVERIDDGEVSPYLAMGHGRATVSRCVAQLAAISCGPLPLAARCS
jgi:ferredoxin-NADP reductase